MTNITIPNQDPSMLGAGRARHRLGGPRKAVLLGAIAVAGIVGTGVAVATTGSDSSPAAPAVTSAPVSAPAVTYPTSADFETRRRLEERQARLEACTSVPASADATERCVSGGPAPRSGRSGGQPSNAL